MRTPTGEIIVTTTFDVPGYHVVRWLGIVRGITVRTRGVGGRLLAGVRSIVGGRVEAYVSMCEVARAEALEFMLQHAQEKGANAVLGTRYDATEVDQGMTEVLAYGTAVYLEPAPR
jgi:uncharacterized protein YbjQ (UPF0145 family)